MEQEEQQQVHQPPPPKKPGYAEIAILWWLHPINVAFYLIIFTTGILTTGAFSYAVGLERDALRNILGDDLAISHKEILYKGFGYRIVRERDTPGQKYSPGEILTNLESRERLNVFVAEMIEISSCVLVSSAVAFGLSFDCPNS